MELIRKKESFVICPENRIYDYILFCDFVFNQKKVFFSKNLNIFDKKDIQIILDLKYLKKFYNYKFKFNSFEIIIFLWNSQIDYINNQKYIKLLKKKFKNLKLINLSKFSLEKNNFLSLDDFSLSETGTLNKIQGISYLKKIKYNYPIIFSIYNFIKYIPRSLKFFEDKLVFVGYGNNSDIYKALIHIVESPNSNNRSNQFKKFCKSKINEFKNQNNIFNLNSLNEISNLKIQIDEKYYVSNLIIRNLILNYLKNFKVFYHKNNSNDAFELLKNNLYKRINHLDLGSMSGNAKIYPRSIVIHRFHKDRNIRLNFFNSKTIYDHENFKNQVELIIKFFNCLYEFKDYDCSVATIKQKFLELNNIL